MQLFCRKCDIPVTVLIKELLDITALNEADGKDLIPKGYYILSNGDYTNTAGKLIINSFDLINCKDHPNGGRLNGCCGLDGQDGPNKVCFNGHEIGTEFSDCWLAHAFVFETTSVNTHPERMI